MPVVTEYSAGCLRSVPAYLLHVLRGGTTFGLLTFAEIEIRVAWFDVGKLDISVCRNAFKFKEGN